MATTPAAGTSTQSTLSEWAGPYVTNMLGQAQALAAQPYQTYQGPLTAGASQLQQNVFSGLGSLTVPQTLGQSFTGTGAPTVPTASLTGATQVVGQPSGIAANYMNPYLQSVLQPQLEEMRRQAQINLQPTLAKLTGAGGYGGSREALMRSEADRNLLTEMTGAIGKGYASAFDTGRQQFNTEQQQAKDLVSMLSQAGQQQRGIEQEGIAADLNEFLQQRDYPMRQTQFLQSMLQGLPISTYSTSTPQMSGIGQLASTTGALGSTYDLLKKLNVV